MAFMLTFCPCVNSAIQVTGLFPSSLQFPVRDCGAGVNVTVPLPIGPLPLMHVGVNTTLSFTVAAFGPGLGAGLQAAQPTTNRSKAIGIRVFIEVSFILKGLAGRTRRRFLGSESLHRPINPGQARLSSPNYWPSAVIECALWKRCRRSIHHSKQQVKDNASHYRSSQPVK